MIWACLPLAIYFSVTSRETSWGEGLGMRRLAVVSTRGGRTWLTFANSNYRVITNWSWLLHNKCFFSLCYDWTRLWILIWKVGPFSVKVKRVCLSRYGNQLVMTPSILASKGKLCPTSSGPQWPLKSPCLWHLLASPWVVTQLVAWFVDLHLT